MNTGGKIIYDINFLLVWREKVLAQVVESTLIVWEDLGSSPMYAYFVCYCFVCYCFKYMLIMLWNNMIFGLY